MTSRPRATLLLEDGTRFDGTGFGAEGEITGEVVFNTAMTGYQEVLTDPSYCGQMVAMTYPLMGNYGINAADAESKGPQLSALIVRELAPRPSNWRSEEDLNAHLKAHNRMGIEGIDTRALVLHIREKGAMRAILSTTDDNAASLQKKVLDSPTMEGRDLVNEVTTSKTYDFPENATTGTDTPTPPTLIAVYDFGIKQNILRLLKAQGFTCRVVPARTSAKDVLEFRPHGLFLSNGPGDPAALPDVIEQIKILIQEMPTFGICLGHQLLALALGGKTYKLKFGHHGANHPVSELATKKVEITSQNHGFCVDPKSLPSSVKVTHLNLNDQTCEGLAHEELPIFAVQYHPEAAPGPQDSRHLFRRFWMMVEDAPAPTAELDDV